MSWPPKVTAETIPQQIARKLRETDERRGHKPSAAPRRQMEADFQIALVEELRLLLIPPSRMWFVPNGGNLSKAQRGKFKAMGLTAGVHDLHLIWADVVYRPQFGTLELKAGKGEASNDQVDFGKAMNACGHRWAVAHAKDGTAGAIHTLRGWGVPLRGSR